MKSILSKSLTLSLGLVLSVTAQINLPRQSPAASVSQTFAYTTATVTYSRPAVKGRVIWGGLVPYGQVWRAGANQATAVEFTTDVRVNGQALAKGKYALFVLPTKEGAQDAWTFIFDTNPNAWGSFGYDGKHDALRVTVKPEKIPHRERLEYGFDALTDSSAVLSLAWEKWRGSLAISAEFKTTAQASILKDLPAVGDKEPYSWMNAARFYRAYGLGDSLAYAWIDRSIAIKPLYFNLWAKAEFLAADKRYAEALETGRKAWIEAAKDPGLESQVPALDKQLKAWEKKTKK
jgi:hypothetical protein